MNKEGSVYVNCGFVRYEKFIFIQKVKSRPLDLCCVVVCLGKSYYFHNVVLCIQCVYFEPYGAAVPCTLPSHTHTHAYIMYTYML